MVINIQIPNAVFVKVQIPTKIYSKFNHEVYISVKKILMKYYLL